MGLRAPRALVAIGKFEIRPMRKKELEVKPVEFDIPARRLPAERLLWSGNRTRRRPTMGASPKLPRCGWSARRKIPSA
jgi:hypothetical protein